MTKKFDSITALKGICCFTVLMTHWYGCFEVTGSVKLDHLLSTFPFSLVYIGIQGVYIFVAISAMFTAMKVYRNQRINFQDEIQKRYINLMIPILVTDLIVFFGLRFGLFSVNRYGHLFGVEFAKGYYPAPISIKKVLYESLIGTITRGECLVYGPFWMMNYIFLGGILIMIYGQLIKYVNRYMRAAIVIFMAFLFSMEGSLFLCTVIGMVLAIWYMQLPEKMGVKDGIIGFIILASGGLLCDKAWYIAYTLEDKGYSGFITNPSWVLMMNAPIIIIGFEMFWRGIIGNIKNYGYIGKFLVNLGERSMGVFCTHWLVIASFSCSFYIRYADRAPKFRLTLNLLLTTILVYIASDIFYRVVQKKLAAECLNYIRQLTMKK